MRSTDPVLAMISPHVTVHVERGQGRWLLFGAATGQAAMQFRRLTAVGDFVQLATHRFDFGGARQTKYVP